MAAKRLIKELDAYHRDPSPAVAELDPLSDDDLLELRAVLRGPEGTGYEGTLAPIATSHHRLTRFPGGLFHLSLSLPATYPSAPPTIRFLTPCVHPNFNFSTGEICLDLLQNRWTPAYGVVSALEAVQQLMSSGGEADSPLNLDVAKLMREGDFVGVEGLVRFFTGVHARG